MRRPTWTDPDKDKESQAAASDDASDDDDGIDRNPCKFPDLLFALAFSAMVCAMIYAAFYYQYAGRVDFDDAVDRDDAGAAVGCGGEATASAAGAANSSLSFRHSKDSRKRDSVFGAATSTTSPTSPVSAASPHGDGALNELFHEMHGAQVPLDGRGVVLGVITRLPATRERVTSGAAAPKSSDS